MPRRDSGSFPRMGCARLTCGTACKPADPRCRSIRRCPVESLKTSAPDWESVRLASTAFRRTQTMSPPPPRGWPARASASTYVSFEETRHAAGKPGAGPNDFHESQVTTSHHKSRRAIISHDERLRVAKNIFMNWRGRARRSHCDRVSCASCKLCETLRQTTELALARDRSPHGAV